MPNKNILHIADKGNDEDKEAEQENRKPQKSTRRKKENFDAETNLISLEQAVSSTRWRTQLGRYGEDFVGQELARQNWIILERNWRAGRLGEVDIISQDPGGTLVFIEVKTRVIAGFKSGFPNEGFESITGRKKRRMVKAAMFFLASRCISLPCRFDVITVTCDRSRKDLAPFMSHVEGAFVPV